MKTAQAIVYKCGRIIARGEIESRAEAIANANAQALALAYEHRAHIEDSAYCAPLIAKYAIPTRAGRYVVAVRARS